MSNALRITHGAFGRVALLDMDRSLVRHAHPHCHVLIKVEGADTQFSVGDDLVPLTDRQVVLVNTWKPHAYVHDQRRPPTIILALYIEPEWLKTFRPNWIASGAPEFFERPAGEISPRIRQIALDLAAIMMADPGANSAQEVMLSNLMISVIERFVPWRTLTSRFTGTDEDRVRFDKRIHRAVFLMRNEQKLPCNVEALAREAGLSRAHFFRLFERSTRMTPHVYMNLLRMEFAVKAAVQTNQNFAALSDQLGFSAPGHFTRFFRDHAGVSPSEFRKVAQMGSPAGA